MTERPVTHATFAIERTYHARPARVFAAFADPAACDRWFVRADNWPIAEYRHDFRAGGQEADRFSPESETIYFNETVCQDVVPDRRIISACTMARGETRISASVAKVNLLPEGGLPGPLRQPGRGAAASAGRHLTLSVDRQTLEPSHVAHALFPSPVVLLPKGSHRPL